MSSRPIDCHNSDDELQGTSNEYIAPPPRLITNRWVEDNMLQALERSIADPDLKVVKIMVSYVTASGIQLLRRLFDELSEREVIVEVVITHQLGISDLDAVKSLAELEKVKLRIFERPTFHSKAWLFLHKEEKRERDTAIIGSSNLSRSALGEGVEINIVVNRGRDDTVIDDLVEVFNECFNCSTPWSQPKPNTWKDKFRKERDSSAHSRDLPSSGQSQTPVSNLVPWGFKIPLNKERKRYASQRAVTVAGDTQTLTKAQFKTAIESRNIGDMREILKDKGGRERHELLNQIGDWIVNDRPLRSASPLRYAIQLASDEPDWDEDDETFRLFKFLLEEGADPNERFMGVLQDLKSRVLETPIIWLNSHRLYHRIMPWHKEKDRSYHISQETRFKNMLDTLLDGELKIPLKINLGATYFNLEEHSVIQKSALETVRVWQHNGEIPVDGFEEYRANDEFHKMVKDTLEEFATRLLDKGASTDTRPTNTKEPKYTITGSDGAKGFRSKSALSVAHKRSVRTLVDKKQNAPKRRRK